MVCSDCDATGTRVFQKTSAQPSSEKFSVKLLSCHQSLFGDVGGSFRPILVSDGLVWSFSPIVA